MDSCTDAQPEKQKQKVLFYALVRILVREDFHQKPEVAEEEEVEEMEGGSELKGRRRGVRHAGVFRTVKGIWSLCLPARGSRERREENTGMKEREKKTEER